MGVITGAIAYIKVGGVVIGKMKSIRINETIQRGNVQGLGSLVPDEKPPLSWAGTLSCDAYTIDFSKCTLPQGITRNLQSVQEWQDSLTLQEQGVVVEIYQRIPVAGQPQIGLIAGTEKPFCQINQLYIDSQAFDISEGQISGTQTSFNYLTPVIYP